MIGVTMRLPFPPEAKFMLHTNLHSVYKKNESNIRSMGTMNRHMSLKKERAFICGAAILRYSGFETWHSVKN